MPTKLEYSRLAYVITKNLRVPKEGPKDVPVQLTFAQNATTSLDLDMLAPEQLSKISMVQGAYIDNGRNGSVLTIIIGTSQQRIDIPPQTQGYLPLLCPNPPKLQFLTAGAIDDIFVHLLNFPVPALLWKTV